MAVVYRSEKKKILRSQMNVVKIVLNVLQNCEQVLTDPNEADKSLNYTQLILAETEHEQKWRSSVETSPSMTAEEKTKEMAKLEEYFYYRRIINATYFKQVKTMILSGDYI